MTNQEDRMVICEFCGVTHLLSQLHHCPKVGRCPPKEIRALIQQAIQLATVEVDSGDPEYPDEVYHPELAAVILEYFLR